MQIEFNDASLLDTKNTGWFLGFSEWTLPASASGSLLRHMPKDMHSHTLCMKWERHCQGDPRGAAKPPSEGRTLSLLVSERGRFRIQFSESEHFPPEQTVEHVLQRHGQFSAWGEGVHHRWMVDEDCTILTLRWIPLPA